MAADFDDVRPRTWFEAFSWLRGVSSGQRDDPWWDNPIDETPDEERRQRLSQLSQLAMSRLSSWSVGQIFPGLSPDLELQTLDLPTRARKALVARQFSTAGHLSALTLDEIIDWRQVGIGTVDAILRALADASTSLPTPSVISVRPHSQHSTSFAPKESYLPKWLDSVIDDVSAIATWQTAIGLPAASLVQGELPIGTPDHVIEARQRLMELNAAAVLDEGELAMDAAGLLDDALRGLDERARQILKLRLFADAPLTLDEIGARFGVSRERIRQIEGKARAAMLDAVSEGKLNMLASASRALIGTVRPLSDLLERMPALGRSVALVGHPVWRVIDRLDDAYEIEDGWCVVPTLSAAKDRTWTQLGERADQYGVVRLEDLDLVETSEPTKRDALTRQWLEACGYFVDGPNVLTRTQSVGDYAAAILSMHGEPMSAQEIIDRFQFERTIASLKNAMSTDERFERVDRDSWALREWDMEAYASIRSVIRKELAKAGGTITIDTLVERITGRYSVTSNSVVAYASMPPFELRNGIVRSAGTSREARKPPERTARMYRRSDAWIYRVRISHDHLRGSGSVAPVAITTILEMVYGDKVQLASELGDQSINWTGPQPAFGTIRRFLLAYDVVAGTNAFLVVGDDRSFDVEVIDECSGNALADALALVGAPGDLAPNAARQALAAAIRLPKDSPVVSVIGAYRERGDSDIADLLMTVRHELEADEPATPTACSADVDDIMELL